MSFYDNKGDCSADNVLDSIFQNVLDEYLDIGEYLLIDRTESTKVDALEFKRILGLYQLISYHDPSFNRKMENIKDIGWN